MKHSNALLENLARSSSRLSKGMMVLLGVAVLLVSADLNEVMELSDSLMVMCGGHIAAYFEDTSELSDEVMGEYMLGLKRQTPEEVRRVCHE